MVNCTEGKTAYNEAIEFLEKQEPLHALELSECLTFAAADHLMDMIMKKFFEHVGSDGSSLSKRVERRCSDKVKSLSLCENLNQLRSFEGPDFAQSTIIKYIIDEGVPSRGHRSNIYNKDMKYVGICMIKDPYDGLKDVMDFSRSNPECLNKDGGASNIKYKGKIA